MRIILIGGTGTIGREVAKALSASNEVISASRSSGDLRIDMANPESVEAFFQGVGKFDAIVSAAGSARFGPLDDLEYEDFLFSFRNKLMGQINLVRIGRNYINDNGSITLTSGILGREPMPGGSAISMVNAGLEGFVRAAQLELERGVRVNVVSPVWVQETLLAMGNKLLEGMPAALVARAYVASVTGTMKGTVLEVDDYT
ncbi:short chain dehydrogenase [Pelotalea chapellei]|uniref:Short chain dehydrogenase n=1 Tax=Pelotalea chapellei TaxID=44671 RepID=A0ABS5U922_9BACT|nr:short chain dehydrogenase [Pelotalea chapellei]MBT1072165.1 short chain dehydrogenase [Pelotalea chapellei]